MAALEPIADQCETPKKRQSPYVSKRGKNTFTAVTMLELERTSHPDCEKKRTVRLLALSTSSLWLSTDDMEWLVTWLAAEYNMGGVPLLEAAVAEDGFEGNCAAPGVHIRWDFDGAWEAIIIDGGKKVIRSSRSWR